MLKVHEINNILNLLFLLDYYQILTGITDNYSYLSGYYGNSYIDV